MKKSIKLNIGIFVFLSFIGIQSLQAQCNEFRHSTNWFDGWLSCEEKVSPNADRGNSHWILYDLKEDFRLFRSYYWNYNDVERLNSGISIFEIDYSTDKVNWTSLGSFTIDRATGSPIYEGEHGPDLGGVTARYVLITAIGNYGADCYGLGEVRFEAERLSNSSTVEDFACTKFIASPNPIRSTTEILLPGKCLTNYDYTITDATGKVVSSGNHDSAENLKLNLSDWAKGIYLMKIKEGNKSLEGKLIKL